jgi:hypothetical protein
LLESGHANTCVNRLYYACFYAVSALLLAKGLSSARHSGERALFHQHIVKPGLLDVPLGQLYDKFFDNRQKGDYADLIRFAVPESGHGSMKRVPSSRTWQGSFNKKSRD